MDHTITDIVRIFRELSSQLHTVPHVNLHIVCKEANLAQATVELGQIGGELDKISLITPTIYVAETNGTGDGWELLSLLCYCAYSHLNHTVYISYPYRANKGTEETETVVKMDFTETLPLERAIRHELGHYKQHMEFGEGYFSINKTILEYHNIIFNENESNSFFGTDSDMGRGKYRLTYNNKNLFNLPPLFYLDKYALNIDGVNMTNDGIDAFVINNKMIEGIVSAIGLNNFDRELYNRISNKLKDNIADKKMQLLFVNLLNELNIIN